MKKHYGAGEYSIRIRKTAFQPAGSVIPFVPGSQPDPTKVNYQLGAFLKGDETTAEPVESIDFIHDTTSEITLERATQTALDKLMGKIKEIEGE